MASLTAPITIHFIPVLEQICACVGLSKPIYNSLDVSENVGYVLVPKGSQPNAYSLKGDRGNTMQDSFESAAEKMVVFLVRKYKIVVIDINLALRRNIEKGIQLFRMKRDDFEAMEKEIPPFRATSLSSVEGVDSGSYVIEIDFLNVLRSVIQKTQAAVTPIEVICLDKMQYKAWFTVAYAGNVAHLLCLDGTVCSSAAAAKQSLAKKAVRHLMTEYNLEIRDVNYHFLDVPRLALKYERDNYIAIKQRVHGLSEEKNPQPIVIKQDQLTPRGEKNKILAINKDPLPLKKRKIARHGKSLSITIPDNVVAAELEAVFKRKKED